MRASIGRIFAQLRRPRSALRFFALFASGNLLVIGAALLLLHTLASRVLEEEAVALNRRLLVQLGRSMDAALLQVDSFLRQLTIDPYLANLPEYVARGDFGALLRINENLNNLRLINSYVHSMAIYFRRDRSVFIPNTGILDASELPDAEFLREIDKGAIPAGWLPVRTIRDPQSERAVSVISVVKFIRYVSGEPQAFVVVNIEENYLRSLGGTLGGDRETEVLVMSARGGVISRLTRVGLFESAGGPEALKEAVGRAGGTVILGRRDRFLVTSVASSLEDWRYVGIRAFADITARIAFLRTYSLIVLALGATLSTALAALYSERLTRMLRSILGLMHPAAREADSEDPLSSIESAARALRDRSNALQRTLEEHMPVLRNKALEDLFKGRLAADEQNLPSLLASYGLSLGRKELYVAIVASGTAEAEAPEAQRSDLAAVVLLDALREILPPGCESAAAFTRDDEIALAIGFDADDGPAGWLDREGSSRMERSLRFPGAAPVALGIGAVHAGLASLSQSYREARRAVRYARTHGGRRVVRYEELEGLAQPLAAYPFEEEEELLEALRAADRQKAERAEAAIWAVLERAEGPAYHFHLLGSILKTALELGLESSELFEGGNPYAELPEIFQRGDARVWFDCLCRRILERVASRRAGRNRRAAERVAAYIAEHPEGELSLHVLSRLVYLSEPYLSRIFREEMGTTLRQYINSVRVRRAKELLRDPTLKVRDVGRRVGYANPHGFLRFFKEQTGMTPLDYRASLRSLGT